MIWRLGVIVLTVFICFELRQVNVQRRRQKFERGRKLSRRRPQSKRKTGLRWGNSFLPESAATQHFLAVGTTGSGKSIVQRLLMKDVLKGITPGSDRRALIFDAKNDTAVFLEHIGVTCPVFNLNPFATKNDLAMPVAWDIAADITSPARALNLAACLIPTEKSGNNQYFSDAARQVLSAIVEALIRHKPGTWTFSEFVHLALSLDRVKELLNRDAIGRETLANFFGDDRTGYQVFTTIASRISYYRPVARRWKKRKERIGLGDWLQTDSVLLLGTNATVDTALSAVNELMFRVLVEEVDVQEDSSSRRTWFWIDEARLSGPLLKNKMLGLLAVKGRSRGACLVLAFQDIDGFREAAGNRIANEIIAQCSHKALLRMESDESARWASRVIGQYETLDLMRSSRSSFIQHGFTHSEQRVKRDAVMPSQFYLIPQTNKRNGLVGYFVSPSLGTRRVQILPKEIEPIVLQ